MPKSKFPIVLAPGEYIISVVPEYCFGPGWSSAVVWVYIACQENKFRKECLQPNEQSPALITLFDIGASVHGALVAAIKREMEERKTSRSQMGSRANSAFYEATT